MIVIDLERIQRLERAVLYLRSELRAGLERIPEERSKTTADFVAIKRDLVAEKAMNWEVQDDL